MRNDPGLLVARAMKTHSAMITMLSRDFPTEVPPNFCTTHGAVASSEFPLRMDREDKTPVGVDAPDKLGCIVLCRYKGILLVI